MEAPSLTRLYVFRRPNAVVSILLFCLMAAMAAHKPLHLDSMDFAAAATATAETGAPVYYRGEFLPNAVGLWHPPLYVYLLAGWFKVFGSGPAQGRAFGVLCVILQGLVVLAIARTLFGRHVHSWLEPWFWAIFLLNPYTVQTAAVLDIDSTIYGPILCLVLLTALRLSWRDGTWRQDEPAPREYVWLAGTMTIAFWAKLTTILLVIPIVGLLLVARFGFARAARVTALTTMAGVGVFVITFVAYGQLVHLNVSSTFTFLVFSFVTRGSSGQGGVASRLLDSWNNASAMVPFMVQWAGLLPWFALAGSISAAGWATLRQKCRRANHLLLLLSLTAATTLYYCGQATTFAGAPFKYPFVFWGLAILGTLLLTYGSRLWRDPSEIPPDLPPLAPVIQLGLAAIYAMSAWYGRYRLGDHPLLEWRVYWWVVVPPALVLIPAIRDALCQANVAWRFSRAAMLAGVCAWGGVQFGVAVYQLQVPHSTTYNYGQVGIEDTAAFIRANTTSDDAVGSMKDLGYLIHRRYYDNYPAVWAGPEATRAFIEALATGRMKYAVFTDALGQDRLAANSTLRQWVESHCNLVATFGDYRIYALRTS